MKVRTRFIKSVIATAKSDATPMPWARRQARKSLIAALDGKPIAQARSA